MITRCVKLNFWWETRRQYEFIDKRDGKSELKYPEANTRLKVWYNMVYKYFFVLPLSSNSLYNYIYLFSLTGKISISEVNS